MTTEFYRGCYYVNKKDNPRVLLATYDESTACEDPTHPSMGFFRPYGDKEWPFDQGDIGDESPISVNGNGSYYKVDLSVAFMEGNAISPIAPGPKRPSHAAGWEPYGNDEKFFEEVRKFSPDSVIGRLVSRLEAMRDDATSAIGEAFQHLRDAQAASEPSDQERHLLAVRSVLRKLVVSDDKDGIVASVRAALPPVLAKPKAESDETGMPDDSIWQFRLLGALATGIHDGRLGGGIDKE